MTPEELVAAACPKIGALGSAFYFDRATLARGKVHGLDGFRFYVLGRGGVLGDVEPRVVTSAFGYFHPAVIDRIWTTAREKVAPRDAGRLYLECCREFGRAHLAGVAGLEAFCEAASAVNDAVDPVGLTLYAAVSGEPFPDDPPARAMQLVTVLREFRGSAHLVAVVTSGLAPNVAHYLRRPNDYASFGWGETAPDVSDEDRDGHARAEQLTDALVLSAYSAVGSSGADALLAGLTGIEAALGR
jgi:hypothetical protein